MQATWLLQEGPAHVFELQLGAEGCMLPLMVTRVTQASPPGSCLYSSFESADGFLLGQLHKNAQK